MIAAVIDTQALIWYLSADARLSERARLLLLMNAHNGRQVGVSAMSLMEMAELVHQGKLPIDALEQLLAELAAPDGLLVETPLSAGVIRLLLDEDLRKITPLPARVIAATAVFHDVPLFAPDAARYGSRVKTVS